MIVILDYCIFYNAQRIEFIVKRHFFLYYFFSFYSPVEMSSSVSVPINKSLLISHVLYL